jgi:hypothetical protein
VVVFDGVGVVGLEGRTCMGGRGAEEGESGEAEGDGYGTCDLRCRMHFAVISGGG